MLGTNSMPSQYDWLFVRSIEDGGERFSPSPGVGTGCGDN